MTTRTTKGLATLLALGALLLTGCDNPNQDETPNDEVQQEQNENPGGNEENDDGDDGGGNDDDADEADD
jgi:hypothetical protein